MVSIVKPQYVSLENESSLLVHVCFMGQSTTYREPLIFTLQSAHHLPLLPITSGLNVGPRFGKSTMIEFSAWDFQKIHFTSLKHLSISNYEFLKVLFLIFDFSCSFFKDLRILSLKKQYESKKKCVGWKISGTLLGPWENDLSEWYTRCCSTTREIYREKQRKIGVASRK